MCAYTSTSLRKMAMISGSVEYNELNQPLSLAIVGTLPSKCLSGKG